MSVNLKPETVGSVVGRRVGTDAAMAKVGLAAAEKRVDVAAAVAACQLAGPAALFAAHHESLEGVAIQVGAAMRFGQGVPAADESLEFAGAETGVEAQTAAIGNGCSGGGRPGVTVLEVAEQLAVADIGSSCVVGVQYLDCAAERFQVEGLVLVVEKVGIRLKAETVERWAGSFGIDADSAAVVVVVDPGVGRGCSALPRPASDSYLRCLLCRVGAARTGAGASLEQSAVGAAGIECPLEVRRA